MTLTTAPLEDPAVGPAAEPAGPAAPVKYVITEEGVYTDLPEDAYHLDPVPEGSLSSSGAKLLLPPHVPAEFDHQRRHPKPATKHMELGTVAHKLVLGSGPDVVEVKADDWRTKAAQAQAKEARERGAVPLLTAQWQQVQEMAAALRSHRTAAKLLSAAAGITEASLFWRCPRTHIMRRARLDHLPHPTSSDRMIVADLKTAQTADPGAFSRSAATYGYPMQAVTYSEGVRELGLADDVLFLFVVLAKEPPYLVNVVQLDDDAMRQGAERNRRAVDTYLQCRTADHWPGYGDGVTVVSLPRWYASETEELSA